MNIHSLNFHTIHVHVTLFRNNLSSQVHHRTELNLYIQVDSALLKTDFVESLGQNKIEGRGPLKPPEQCSPIKPQCPATAVGQITNSDVSGPLKTVVVWTGGVGGGGNRGLLRSSASNQQPTRGFKQASAWWSSKKIPIPVQIRSPNFHISSFTQCSLWWLCGAGGGGGWGFTAKAGKDAERRRWQGRSGGGNGSLFLYIFLSLCLSS